MGVAGAPYRLADPLGKIASGYAAVVIDTRPSFSLLTEMALLAATDAIVPVEPRYLETVGLMSVIGKINDIREGWRHPQLRISGILVTKMDSRIRGHNHLLDELKAHPVLGKLMLGVTPHGPFYALLGVASRDLHVNHTLVRIIKWIVKWRDRGHDTTVPKLRSNQTDITRLCIRL